jgi:hypothetical protein
MNMDFSVLNMKASCSQTALFYLSEQPQWHPVQELQKKDILSVCCSFYPSYHWERQVPPALYP